MKRTTNPEHYHWIDALRGLAAIVIVIYHYHHFYLADALDRPNLPDTSTFPYASIVGMFYLPFAAHAVELFWIISGFIFAHVYLPLRVSLWEFGVARFARLYPLHALTLVTVAFFQTISLNLAGHWQIYANNDLRHFGLQSIMASNWSTLSRGLSFNGPIWSVSLEIIVYGFFFVSLPAMRRAPTIASLLLSMGCWAISASDLNLPLVGKGVFACGAFFFLGSATYGLCFRARPGAKRIAGFAACLIAAAALSAWLDFEIGTVAGLGCALMLAIACLDLFGAEPGRKLRRLGDISYSIYLVHVPLQIMVLLIADLAFGGSRRFAESHFVLPLYLGATLILARIVHSHYELPARKFLRNLLLARRKPMQVQPAGRLETGHRTLENYGQPGDALP